MNSTKKTARLAGTLYLIYMVIFIPSTFVQSSPIVSGDAASTARNIMAHVWLFRIGLTMELVAALFFLLAAWALYVLLKTVNKNLALLFLLLNLVGVAIECTSTLIHFAPVLLLSGADYLKVFRPDQMQGLAMLFLNFNGGMISILFYGMWLFPLGYLVFKSGFLPRTLGVLLILDGFSCLISFFQLCLFPGYEKYMYALYPIMFIAEFGLALWLLIKGVKDQPLETIS